ncbi:MAG: OmpW family protein [Flavobacteriaceae bacterium]|nr:OmpW family protein [Flavobacteriaceae bacterium]
MKTITVVLLSVLTFGMLNAQEASNENNSKWKVKVRGNLYIPNEMASSPAIYGDFMVQKTIAPSLEVAYYLADNWAVELGVATSENTFSSFNEVTAQSFDFGSYRLIPLTLTLQYILDGEQIRPYLGAGVNYTPFIDKKASRSFEQVSIDNAVGFVAQLGFDYKLCEKWFLNFDIKYIVLHLEMETEAKVTGAINNVDFDINPLMAGAGIGYRF